MPHQVPGSYWLNDEIRESYGNWLSELGARVGGWDWWVTLTFRDRELEGFSRGWSKIGGHYADKAFKSWVQSIPNNYILNPGWRPTHLTWVRGTERTKTREVPHFHSLIAGCKDQRRSEAWANWFKEQGLARIEPYDKELGAGYYLCKYAVKNLGEVEFSPGFPQ